VAANRKLDNTQASVAMTNNEIERTVGSCKRMVLNPKAHHGVVVMSNCNFAKVGVISTAIYSALHDKR
jgi:hypothetical protein